MAHIHLEPISRRTTKGEILALVERVGDLSRSRVGKIELRGREAIVEVPEGSQQRIARALDGQLLAQQRLRVWADDPQAMSAAEAEHFQRLANLLRMEGQEAARQAAERASKLSPAQAEQTGLALAGLVILEEDTGLGGRYLLRLAKRGGNPLPWTRIDIGTPVLLSPMAATPLQGERGVVYQRDARSIGIALSGQWEPPDAELWRVDVCDDDVALQRQQLALSRAAQARGDRLAELREVLLGKQLPAFAEPQDLSFIDAKLNAAQREAIQFALSCQDVALIHGPPGTGKTTAVVELICQAVRQGLKVLATAPSNTAVDNMLARLVARGERAVRLGHPARVHPQLRQQTLDLLVEKHADVRLAHKMIKEARSLFMQAARRTRAKPEPGMRQQLRQEARSLIGDARRLEMQAVEQILDQATVLCATTTGLDSEVIGNRHFDLAVVDEACQSIEPGCWTAVLRCDRLVLAGDHCQLPPTVVSRQAAAEGLSVSMFERLMDRFGSQVSRQLVVQYRMHEAIMSFSSREFYADSLQADPSVVAHLLSHIAGVQAAESTEQPLEFLDTAGANYDEEQESDGESRLNPSEAQLVKRRVMQLIDLGLAPQDIAVISPYAAQVRLLRQLLPIEQLEIDSVDGFQGREKEFVVVSLVRSNARGEIGFLGDVRRMNVAMTRARRRLVMIGDSATLSTHPFYQRLLEYAESRGAYHTVWEEDALDGT